MTATDPTTAPAQPATPGFWARERAILRWAAERLNDPAYVGATEPRAAILLGRMADELDAAPAAHEPGVQPDWCGYLAGKAAEALRQLGHTGLADHVEHLERAHAAGNPKHLYGAAGPPPTAPPAGTEGDQ